MSLTHKLREVMAAINGAPGFDKVLEKVPEAQPQVVVRGAEAPRSSRQIPWRSRGRQVKGAEELISWSTAERGCHSGDGAAAPGPEGRRCDPSRRPAAPQAADSGFRARPQPAGYWCPELQPGSKLRC